MWDIIFYIIYGIIVYIIISFFANSKLGWFYVLISPFVPMLFAKIFYGEWVKVLPVLWTWLLYSLFYFKSRNVATEGEYEHSTKRGRADLRYKKNRFQFFH